MVVNLRDCVNIIHLNQYSVFRLGHFNGLILYTIRESIYTYWKYGDRGII